MKKVYRIISTILIAAMITSSLSVMAAPNYVEQTEEVLGTSVQTPAEPTSAKPSDDDIKLDIVDGVIQIDDEQELNKIGNDNSYPLDGEYILTTDITMTENFHPIGKEGAPFIGTFDGDGHVIYNLTIKESGDNVGLFGVVSEGGVIKNVGVENGSVISEGLKVGGLVGWAAEATIENSYFVGDVSGDVAVGGVVGASGQIGAFNTASTIKNCYQVGTVKGNNVVGGIEGVAASPGFSFSKMENCYHVGEIICAEAWCGGLIGYLYAEISYYYENSYYDIEQCGSVVKNAVGYQTINKYSSNIKGLTTEQMTLINMIGFEEDYGALSQPKIDLGKGYYRYYYPQLNIFVKDTSDMNEYPSIELYEPQDSVPVEDDDPSTISTAEELQKIGTDKNYPLDGNYRLTNDIDMSGVEKFDPIGSEKHPFTGKFNGNGHKIYNLYVDVGDDDDYAGLFANIEDAEIQNLGIENGYIKGSDYVGGLAGSSSNSIIRKCYFTGEVEGYDEGWGLNIFNDDRSENVGGLVGCSDGHIDNCYTVCKVTGTRAVGGIFGWFVGGHPMNYCYHAGIIVSEDIEDSGPLIGYTTPGHDYSCQYIPCYYDIQNEGDVNIFQDLEQLKSVKGLYTYQMTGPDALNYMTDMEEYTAAPNEDGYPQLSVFVRDKNDPSQFPTIDMAE